ncbi:putative bifunctional methylthioribulose-1-phosphate dehydratase/enolase-phosphatase E1 [Triticum urartu]|uniref:Putative bifunctional methylthioribulose-1-phosphate dehydratase/enolase-phosphatase E1 n=1 Tax=Triticum urartu TaxID=4572 RepID=M8AFX6_TRIUA|nr:putative bifunctional methylthioribulose-1-phosphate dehydratase/enolase-phosphatase E1 [Triticum urartu]
MAACLSPTLPRQAIHRRRCWTPKPSSSPSTATYNQRHRCRNIGTSSGAISARASPAAPVTQGLDADDFRHPLDKQVVISVLMKLAGGCPSLSDQLNVDAFLEQARSYDKASSNPVGWYIRNAQTRELSHPLPRCVVVDIEGTTTPISFVADVLFPYARANARAHLAATYHTQQTREDVALLRAQIDEDLAEGVTGAVALPPPDDIDQDKTIDGLVANVQAMIDADRKLTALKQLQGRVWRRGFESGEIKGEVYDDVVQALAEWDANGIKSYIYSSGSREAQRLIFGNTAAHGDLRRYLSAFFDTNVGGKKESRSYYEIWQTLGVDSPSQILFLTDVYQEATAARDAGLEVLISIRPGNAPLPEDHGFQTITSFAQIAT